MIEVKQRLIIGKDTISTIRSLFLDNGWDKVLIVSGKQSYETSGAKQFIEECLSGLNVRESRFCGFANNPNIADLNKGLGLTKGLNPSVIVAIGGGSVLDMGKLLRFFITHDGEILGGKYKSNGKEIPLIAIPTTAGTGAEATHFAVLYDEQGKKHSIANEAILPDYAVIYPELTYNQSPYVTACAGFDALAQSIEAYWNKNATPESDEYALKAMQLIYPSLPVTVNAPTSEARNRMAEGAYWAGRAINITKTTAPHAFSYPFTAHYGIPHGHAISIVFPDITELNLTQGSIPEEKKLVLRNLLGIEREVDIKTSLRTYIDDLGLDIPTEQYNMEKILDGISLERLANNPIDISKSKAKSLIDQIIYR